MSSFSVIQSSFDFWPLCFCESEGTSIYCTLKNWMGREPSVDDGTTDHLTMTDSSLRRVMLGLETLGRFAVESEKEIEILREKI